MTEIIYKQLGETSFQAIERFRKENPKLEKERLSFAGRLDPMAEGYMLILVGDDNDKRDDFLGLDKIYESEFLFGVQTDTFDLMGLIKNIKECETDEDVIKNGLQKYIGKYMQKFPPFSKRHVKGKAMFVWASEGRLDEIEIPEHEVEVYSIKVLEISHKKLSDVARESIERVSEVKGDFRQEKIIDGWKKYLENDTLLPLVKIEVSCGTGTYIRQIAEDLGQDIGCGACVYTIKRTQIGDLV